MVRPIAGFQFVLNQAVGGAGIGHAQQRLGQHHQRQALLGGERVGVQEILHPAKTAGEPADTGANRLHQTGGAGIDTRLGLGRAAGGRQKRGGDRLIRRRIGRGEGRNVARDRGLYALHGSSLRAGPQDYLNRAILEGLGFIGARPKECSSDNHASRIWALISCSLQRHVLC